MPNIRILVLDDDPEIVSAVRRGLAYEGYTVDTASNGPEALAKAREKEPDLVILDIMMPGIDGLEVAKRLRQGSDVPIIMLTARGTVADKVTGLGLAIVKGIAEQHGGRVTVISEPGKGSTFTVWLKL